MPKPSRLSFFTRGLAAAALIVTGATVVGAAPVAGPEAPHPLGTRMEYDLLRTSRSAQYGSWKAQGYELTDPVQVEAEAPAR